MVLMLVLLGAPIRWVMLLPPYSGQTHYRSTLAFSIYATSLLVPILAWRSETAFLTKRVSMLHGATEKLCPASLRAPPGLTCISFLSPSSIGEGRQACTLTQVPPPPAGDSGKSRTCLSLPSSSNISSITLHTSISIPQLWQQPRRQRQLVQESSGGSSKQLRQQPRRWRQPLARARASNTTSPQLRHQPRRQRKLL